MKADANAILLAAGTEDLRERFDSAPIALGGGRNPAAAPRLETIDGKETPLVIRHCSDETTSPAPSTEKRHSRPALLPVRASDLLAKDLPDPKFIVSGYISEGLTILAGRPEGRQVVACTGHCDRSRERHSRLRNSRRGRRQRLIPGPRGYRTTAPKSYQASAGRG